MSLGTKFLQVFLISNDIVLGFSLAFGHLGEFYFLLLIFILLKLIVCWC